MKPDPGRVVFFITVLIVIAAIINIPYDSHSSRSSRFVQQPNQRQASPIVVPAPQSSPPPPEVVPVRVWPADFTPTKVIAIPDPAHPAKGAIDTTLRDGDDLEFDIASLWTIEIHLPDSVEHQTDDGAGFQNSAEYAEKVRETQDAGTDSWWYKTRIVRIRIKPGYRGPASFRTIIDRKSEEDLKPLIPPPPQHFENLSVSVQNVDRLGNGVIRTTVAFSNTDSNNAIAVALHNRFSFSDDPNISMIAANGKEFVRASYAGILSMYANPHHLTEIAPNETELATFTWNPGFGPSQPTSPLKLQIECVLNSHYSRDSYPEGYRTPTERVAL